jgi:hypothetical protein
MDKLALNLSITVPPQAGIIVKGGADFKGLRGLLAPI